MNFQLKEIAYLLLIWMIIAALMLPAQIHTLNLLGE